MKKRSVSSVLYVVFVCLFMGGIALGMIGRFICIRDTQNYQELQPELFAPDEIATVLWDTEQKQIYVCYNDASHVNVYTESGEFLWAVSTPYLRNSYFELQVDRLIIYNDEAYIYSSADGSFIGCVNAEDLSLKYDWESQGADEFEEGEFYFDTFQVYRARADGSLEKIVSRPWWYRCFHFATGWSIAFFSGVGICILIFLRKKKAYDLVRGDVVFGKRGMRVIYNYFRVASAAHILFAILNIISGALLSLGIFPLTFHFIISSLVFEKKMGSISLSRKETAVLDYWKTVEFGSFIIAVLSAFVAVFIAA